MSASHPSEAEGRTPLSDEQQAMTGAWLLREEAGCVAYCMRCDQRAAWKSDERKAAMYAAADAIERLAARSPASRDAMQETVRPDDQQNVGVDELPACQTSFRVADQQRVVSIAKTDNGRGVTSAGGESGLPHHNPDLWSRVCQSIDHSRVVAMAHTMDDFIGEIQKSEFSAKDVAAARRFLARVEECCDEIPPAAPIVEARDADTAFDRELAELEAESSAVEANSPDDFDMNLVVEPISDEQAVTLRAWAKDMDLRRARELVAEADREEHPDADATIAELRTQLKRAYDACVSHHDAAFAKHFVGFCPVCARFGGQEFLVETDRLIRGVT